ncbi:hypothetical protein [Paenibacillus marinisediminis]
MAFEVATSYTLDALNFLNVLTRDEFYVKRHVEDHQQFLSMNTEANQRLMSEIIRIQGGTMLSPFLTLVVSSVPDFDSYDLSELLRSKDLLQSYFSRTPYYQEDSWGKKKELFSLASEVIPVFKEINHMLGPSSQIDHIVLYLCSYAAPHGIKIAGPRFISDVSYRNEITLGIAIHEMFHPPYRVEQLDHHFDKLKHEPELLTAFNKQKERFGYTKIEGFIEENVVEAMGLYICEKIGLEKDPYTYLNNHDDGSHVLSVILLNYMQNHPKDGGVDFQDYYNEFLKTFPFSNIE